MTATLAPKLAAALRHVDGVELVKDDLDRDVRPRGRVRRALRQSARRPAGAVLVGVLVRLAVRRGRHLRARAVRPPAAS